MRKFDLSRRDELKNSNSEILKLLSESIDENEIRTLDSFKEYSSQEKENLITALSNFKESIIKNREEDEKYTISEALQTVDNLKQQSFLTDRKWENLLNRMDSEKIHSQMDVPEFQKVSAIFKGNNNEIKESIIQNKPLGEIGEITINEVVDKGITILSPEKKDKYPGLVDGATSFLTAFFLHKGVVKMYDKIAFKEESNNLSVQDLIKFREFRSKELKTFMLVAAPLIVGSLYTIKQVSFAPKIVINTESVSATDNKEIVNDSIKYTSFIPFIKNKRMPSWLKQFIYCIIIMIGSNLILKYLGLGKSQDIISNLFFSYLGYVKLFLILGSIITLFMLCYYILSLYLFRRFSQGKIEIPIYLPEFVLNWLKFIKEISKSQNKGLYIETYFRLIFIYLFIFLLVLFALNLLILQS